YVVLGLSEAEPRRVDVALHVVGNDELEILLPGAVLEVVIVEMDRAIFRCRMNEVLLASAPVEARGSAHRQVHAHSIEPAPGNVRHAVGGDAVRPNPSAEVPAREQALGGGFAGCYQGEDLLALERAAVDLRAIELPVEMSADDRPRSLAALDPARHHQRHPGVGKDYAGA